MLKAAGLLMLFSGAFLLGNAQADRLMREERELGSLLEFLRQLTLHLKTSMAPPRELIARLARQSTLADCTLLKELDAQFAASNSFRRNITLAVESTGLQGTAAGDVLLALGDEIGEKPLEHQLSALSSATIALERELESARTRRGTYAPLYRRLGLLGGLLVVVLLV